VKTALTAVLLLALASLAPAAGADFSGFAFQPHPGAHLPLGAPLFDEHGQSVRLGQFFGKHPVVLVLDYLRCKTLCGVTLDRLAAALDALPLDAGRDYEVVTLSIDPRDTPSDLAAAKAKDTAGYDHPGGDAGWHFLGGAEPVLRHIADTIGFPYRYDPALDQYLHPAGFVVAAPDGAVSHYLLGVDPSPTALRSALADAKAERSVGPLTRLLLLCHGADRHLGRYTLPVEAAFILANLAAFLGAIAVFAAIWRRRHG
jgi:protein SCO1/2